MARTGIEIDIVTGEQKEVSFEDKSVIDMQTVRSYRNALLAATDKFLLPDWVAKLGDEVVGKLMEYRQQLRDITLQKEPKFPMPPDEIMSYLKEVYDELGQNRLL